MATSNLPDRTFPEYFTQLATNYARSTGDSTYKVISTFLHVADPPAVDADSILNDNACGPGTATAAVIDFLGSEPARVEATDNVPVMIDAVEHRIKALKWKSVKASVMDFHELSFPDDTFTGANSNINVPTYRDPSKCLRDVANAQT